MTDRSSRVGSRQEPGKPAPVPSDKYDPAYYLEDCDGHEVFRQTGGEDLPLRLERVTKCADLWPGMRVLDVGSGRGELVHRCAVDGVAAVGVDYAAAALSIARTLRRQRGAVRNASFAMADCCALPFAGGVFDRVILADLVEHLHPWQLERALAEACRVLRPSGLAVVHTAPNLWYYRYGYPFLRLFEALRGRRLPVNPRARYEYHEEVHVNEQTPFSLRRSLKQAGFANVLLWLEESPGWEQYASSRCVRLLIRTVLQVPPFRWVFRNELFAVAER